MRQRFFPDSGTPFEIRKFLDNEPTLLDGLDRNLEDLTKDLNRIYNLGDQSHDGPLAIAPKMRRAINWVDVITEARVRNAIERKQEMLEDERIKREAAAGRSEAEAAARRRAQSLEAELRSLD